MEKAKKLLPVVLTLLLVIALAMVAWLFSERAALQQQADELENRLTVLQDTLTGVKDELTRAEDQLATANGTASGLEAELAAAQASLMEANTALENERAALAEMTASRDAAEAQLATLQQELDALIAEKAAIDAAFAAAGFTRVPQFVDSMPVDENGQNAAVEGQDDEPASAGDGDAEEAPDADAAGEFFSDAPVGDPYVEDEKAAVTVYTVGTLGVAFEAPVDWIILTDDEESCFAMRAEECHDGVYASLMIRSADAADFPELQALEDGQTGDGNTVLELLGATGLEAEHEAMNEAGASGLFRACAMVVEGEIYCVSVMACEECFEQVMNDFFLPLCGSMRLIP